MSVAIAKALPTCIFRTQRQVGFALDRKLLLGFTNRLNLSLSRRSLRHMHDPHIRRGLSEIPGFRL
jgi:hypothetical protein